MRKKKNIEIKYIPGFGFANNELIDNSTWRSGKKEILINVHFPKESL